MFVIDFSTVDRLEQLKKLVGSQALLEPEWVYIRVKRTRSCFSSLLLHPIVGAMIRISLIMTSYS